MRWWNGSEIGRQVRVPPEVGDVEHQPDTTAKPSVSFGGTERVHVTPTFA